MSDVLLPALPGRVRGRSFEKGRPGNPSSRRPGSRHKVTLAAAALLAGEAEALTRTAVELALAGEPTAMRLCIERLLPPCRERTVMFSLPPIESISDISAMQGLPRQGRYHTGRSGNDRGGGRDLHQGYRINQKASVCCKSAADFGAERL